MMHADTFGPARFDPVGATFTSNIGKLTCIRDLKFRLVVRMSIIGLVTHPETSTQISDVACPFELPGNSV